MKHDSYRAQHVKIDLLFDPFGGSWPDFRAGALAAEEAGFDGIWTWDHLAGSVHRAPHVLECWTALTAMAAVTDSITIGSLVLNVANRPADVIAQMAATLQEVAGGRLVLGLGAGGHAKLPYAAEQIAAGRAVGSDPQRRAHVRETVVALRQLWTGRAVDMDGDHVRLRGGVADGYLQPAPPPPIILGAFGPRMARLAGAVADGINVPAMSADLRSLVDMARSAHAEGGKDPHAFLVTVFATLADPWLDPTSRARAKLAMAGVDRLILITDPPYRISEIATPR